MAVRRVFLFVVLMALMAATGSTQTPGADKLLDALAKHDRVEALRRILSIESLSGRPQPVSTPAEFVDRIINCQIAAQERRTSYAPQMQVDWSCPDGRYRAWLFETPNKPFVVVGEFWDPKRMAAEFDEQGKPRLRRLAPPAPPRMPLASPPPDVPPDRGVVARFGQVLEAGKPGALLTHVLPGAKVTLYRRDVVHSVSLVEETGQGPDALARILPIARSKVELELELTCKVVGQLGSCTLESDVGDYYLVALFSMQGSTIGRVEFFYFNPRTIRQDAAD